MQILYKNFSINEEPNASILGVFWMCAKLLWILMVLMVNFMVVQSRSLPKLRGIHGENYEWVQFKKIESSFIYKSIFIICKFPTNWHRHFIHSSTIDLKKKKSQQINCQTTFSTFDQPLYIWGIDIVHDAPEDSYSQAVVIKLGGFLTIVVFRVHLFCNGWKWFGSFIELNICTQLWKKKMLTGHAHARTKRGHCLVQNLIDTKRDAVQITFEYFNLCTLSIHGI